MLKLLTTIFPQARIFAIAGFGILAAGILLVIWLVWNDYQTSKELVNTQKEIITAQKDLLQKLEDLAKVDKALNEHDLNTIRGAVEATRVADVKLQKDIAEIKRINKDAIATGCPLPPTYEYLLERLRDERSLREAR